MPNAAKTPVADFFLGALSPAGFTGWFAEAAAEAGQTYLIKAGPGCGKSTLMRRLLEADTAPAGGYNERIHCSSDPASLDGAALRGAGALFLDATAPHTLDCKYPGAAERVVCLYDTLDNAGLAARRGEVLALGARNTALLRQAAAHWALACGLLASRRALAALALDTARLDAFARRLANRTMPPRRAACPGKQAHRLLSAPTPGGLTVFTGTAAVLAPQTLYILQDADGAAAARLLGALADHAQKNGYDAVLCHCATEVRGKLDHLFIPALGLGFVTANAFHPMPLPGRRIRLARFADAETLAAHRALRTAQKREAAALLQKTCALQIAAKTVHDALETHYIRATDFEKVNAVRTALAQELFG